MRIDPRQGIIQGAAQRTSPHFDARPAGCDIDLVVIHSINLPPGRFGGPWIDDLFMGRLKEGCHPYLDALVGVRVSSHVLIRRTGEVVQFVPFAQRAWHAGVSRYDGRDRCNDFSVGIELEGEDHTPYAPAQYAALMPLLSALLATYSLSPSRVVGHCHIAPTRKTDPGPAFDWPRLRREIGVPTPE